MNNKFKAGDIIIGNSNANKYFIITKEGWVGVVIKVEDSGHITAVLNSNPTYKRRANDVLLLVYRSYFT